MHSRPLSFCAVNVYFAKKKQLRLDVIKKDTKLHSVRGKRDRRIMYNTFIKAYAMSIPSVCFFN